ncbi:MAG TPA: hypothetical protein VHE78_09445 [Gemmatimonadaceae bacterium]|nr:hypothetical protein [Gemmatimonadaceae bacterium]
MVVACTTEQVTAPIKPGVIALSVVSGDAQAGAAGTELALPLVVAVTDSKGKGVAGLTVNFRVVSGGGNMWAGSATTDKSGTAEDYWTLGTSTAVLQQVEVRAVSSAATKDVYGVFTANVLPGPATRIAKSAGDGQTVGVGTSVPLPPSAKVTDVYGNPIAGVVVTFTVVAGGGAVTGPSSTTNSSGIATVGTWTMGTAACDNSVAAAAAGLSGSPLTFSATAPGNCWRTLAPMPTARTALRMAALNGILYAVGGFNANTPQGLATVEAYDPSANTWTTKASMPTLRASMALAVVDGTLYAIGGGCGAGFCSTVVAYDPSSDTWSTKSPIPLPRVELVAGVANGMIYAIGGFNNVTAGGYLSAVESYDPFTNVWTSNASHTSMPTPRYALAMGAVGGLLYAVGGQGNSGLTGALEAYNATADSWTIKTSMPTPRLALGVGVSGGLLYAVGGAFAGGASAPSTGALEVYDAAANVWSTKTSMPTARYSMGVTMVNGVLYAVGGNSSGVAVGTVEAYKP